VRIVAPSLRVGMNCAIDYYLEIERQWTGSAFGFHQTPRQCNQFTQRGQCGVFLADEWCSTATPPLVTPCGGSRLVEGFSWSRSPRYHDWIASCRARHRGTGLEWPPWSPDHSRGLNM